MPLLIPQAELSGNSFAGFKTNPVDLSPADPCQSRRHDAAQVKADERMRVMPDRGRSLLEQIEAGVLDDTVSMSSLLQKIIALGGRAGSEKMREWAHQEIHGYRSLDDIPEYRRLRAQVQLVITNPYGHQPHTQTITGSTLGSQFREYLNEKKIELEDVPLATGIGELEALARSGEATHKLIPWWAETLLNVLNSGGYLDPEFSRAAHIYWAVSDVSMQGLLVRARAALVELTVDLIKLTPDNQEVPDKTVADAATVYLLTGDRTVVNILLQQASEGGTNVAATSSGNGDAIAAGADGTAIGSQTASGDNSTVVGSQSVRGDSNTVAGRDLATPAASEPAQRQGWWARLRARGMWVAFFTVIGSLAGIAGAVFAFLQLAK